MEQIQIELNPTPMKAQVNTLEAENQKLIELGYENSKKNLRLLSKLEGNLEKAIEALKLRSEKRLQREEKRKNRVVMTKEEMQLSILNEIKEKGFESQIEKLNEMGFNKQKRNLRLLKKFEGNLEKVLAKLQKTPKEKKERIPKEKKEKAEKEEKREKRERKERREKKEKSPENKVACAEYEVIPENITTIYLDGNNMLFCENAIRGLVLHRKRLAAENVLSNIAQAYGELSKRFNIVLVYDRTKFHLMQKFANEAGKDLDYTVLSAAPKYESSDDALVDWAQVENDNAKNCLFVTSDRELQRRLLSAGVTDIMKPGRWLKLVKVAIGEEKYNSLLPNRQDENPVNQH